MGRSKTSASDRRGTTLDYFKLTYFSMILFYLTLLGSKAESGKIIQKLEKALKEKDKVLKEKDKALKEQGKSLKEKEKL